ncbi:MAG: (2Fe-2S) ferredoxin domain-containing protein [candidate division KSB1 bacterium]|nr:(2Fe-2S) ferredoxin domain-containing protein [candidate division KSB1 bacterium]
MKETSKFRELREAVRKDRSAQDASKRVKITIGMGSCGLAAGARETFAALLRAIEREGVEDVVLFPTGCQGLCSEEPLVTVETEGQRVVYARVDAETAERIVVDHLVKGRVVAQHLLMMGEAAVAA